MTPPQTSPDFVKNSPLADSAGWVDVDHKVGTLRHTKFENVYSLGDVMNAPNAKTGAAVRKQAPIVAHNIVKDLMILSVILSNFSISSSLKSFKT